jgi:hypothetical protein
MARTASSQKRRPEAPRGDVPYVLCPSCRLASYAVTPHCVVSLCPHCDAELFPVASPAAADDGEREGEREGQAT